MAMRTALGYWWIPGNEASKSPGMLSWDNENDSPASLELVQKLAADRVELEGFAPLFVGVAEGAKYSLVDCTRGGPSFGTTSPNELWTINHVGIGSHMESAEDLFGSCVLTMDGLGGWITADELHRIRSGYPQKQQGSEPGNTETIKIAEFSIADCRISLQASSSPGGRYGVLEDYACTIWLLPASPRSFDSLKREVILPLQSLVSVSTGSRGSIRIASFSGANNESLTITGGVWTRQHTFVSKWKLKPLVSAHQILTQNGPSLDRWGDIYAQHAYALTTFQGVPLLAEAPQEAMVFMTLVSCLEALLDGEGDKRFSKDVLRQMREAVRDLLPEEVREDVLQAMGALRSSALRVKLEKFILSKPHTLGKVAETHDYTSWTARRITNTRDRAAHSTPDLSVVAATGSELHALQELVRKLIYTRLLEYLGFEDDEISSQFEGTFEFGTTTFLDVAWQRHMGS